MAYNQNNSYSQLFSFLVFAFFLLLSGTLSSPSSSSSHSHGTSSSSSSSASNSQKPSSMLPATRKKSTNTSESKNCASDVPRVTRHSTREALRRAQENPLSLKRAWYLFDHRNAKRVPTSVPGSTGLAMRRAKEQPADLVLAWHLFDRPTPSVRPVAYFQMDASGPPSPSDHVDGGSASAIHELESTNTRLQATIDGLKKEVDLLKAKNARLMQTRTSTRINLDVSSPVVPSSPRLSALSSYNRTPVNTPIVPPTSRPILEQQRERRERGTENNQQPNSPTPFSQVGRPDNAPNMLSPIRTGLLFPAAEPSAAAARAPLGITVAAASSTTSEAVRSPAVSSISSAAFSAAVRHRQTVPSPAVASTSSSSSASRKRPSPESASSESKRARTDSSPSPTLWIPPAAHTRIPPAAQVAPATAALDQDEALARRLQQQEDERALAMALIRSEKEM